MKSLKAKFRKSDAHEWSKNDERLLAAVEHGEVEKVASLLTKKGASAVKLDNEGKSALHVAATRGQTDCLAVILAHGVDTSIIDTSGFSALHLAAKNNHQECAKKLIQSKCVLDALDSSGKTALHHAAASGSIGIVQTLCEHKCPVNIKDTDGLSPLLLSARHAQTEVCGSLLDWGADVNACDKNGRTAVMLASESSSVSVVEVLVQRGADLQAVDSLGHDVLHYAKMSGSSEVKAVLTAALHKAHCDSDTPKSPKSPKTPQHDQVARLGGDPSTTPKKRKAPPPPISPVQMSSPNSPAYMTPNETPVSSKSFGSKVFNYKEEELQSVSLREEVEKLQGEKCILLETIEDLKQIVDQTVTMSQTETEPGPKAEDCGKVDSALVVALQAKITALSLENQQLAQILKKRPSPQGGEGGHEDSSRPDSMNSNASYHTTHESPSETQLQPQGTEEDMSEGSALELSITSLRQEEEESEEGGKEGGEEEIRLLRETLGSIQSKLQETQKENRTLHARFIPEQDEEKGREGKVLLESLAELQAKLTETQEKHQQAREDVLALRAQIERGGAGGRELAEQELQRLRSSLEQEVKELRSQLAQSGQQRERDVGRIRELEARLKAADHSSDHDKSLLVDRYKEAQEEIRMLQEALRGTVPVEAAANDFEEMKGELGSVIDGLQRRLLELSKSYSEAKSELSSTRNQLEETRAVKSKPGSPVFSPVKEQDTLRSRVEELQASLADTQSKYSASLEEIALLKQEADALAQGSVALADHTQVVSSLGSAIKDLEDQADALRQQLSQRALQVDALQNRLTVEKDHTPDDSISRLEHEQMRGGLETEVGHLTQLLQGALRKQDEVALDAAAAWQELKEGRSKREALQELTVSREKENHALSTKLRGAQDAIAQLKKLVEGHVSSEREKNKKIDDLSREVGKLKDALNSLSQLSYSAGSAKRQQTLQQQQLDNLQQQVKQLQYQLGESKRQHHEIVSVYRMHLLYAVQGQMDEDVQKALKQILRMCKMPTEAK
ncbi:ankycorbin isoform X2 [Oncorhynchus tshawytscha]|uniref:Retinoic acid induced 14 n=1 Tax=Oncorhynchus tshawytscha TaxID=74940 RepID=A0A8C8C2D1_ONCTS|nr:ankycorbin isoform X2 [Oncorhynchus tshawytscha]XP_024236609.1 ankycorbin isoform X2 [Oncorhynchus tshawytscha]